MSPKNNALPTFAPADGFHRPHSVPTPAATPRSAATRMLHASILVAVSYQLVGSQFLSRPMPGEAPDFAMLVHQYVGLASMGLVLLFWLWTLIRRGETSLGQLFPWLSPNGVRAVLDDTRNQARYILRRQVTHDVHGAMSSAIHGLGLVTLTAMAFTGTVYFIVDSGAGARTALTLHKILANLMWAYLIGHAGVALLHHFMGSDILSRMFWYRIGRRDDGRSAADMLDTVGQAKFCSPTAPTTATRCVPPWPIEVPGRTSSRCRAVQKSRLSALGSTDTANLVERFFSKLEHSRAVATRFEKHDANYLAIVKLAVARIWMRIMSR